MTHNARTEYRSQQLLKTTNQSVWKVVKNHHTHHKPVPPLNGAEDFTHKCQLLRRTLFPQNPNAHMPLPPGFVSSKMDHSANFSEVRPQEIHDFLAKAKTLSSPGHDGISYSIMKRIHQLRPCLLAHLYSAILRLGTHPQEWKIANCVVVPKPNKSSYQDPKSYRPISLLPCLSKALEHIAARRIASAATQTGALGPTQMGSRTQYSAIHALLHTIDPAAKALAIRKKTGTTAPRPTILAHDIEGAFNNVRQQTLIELMKMRCLPSYLITWATSFTSHRQLGFAFDQKNEPHQPFNSGLPKGSPASPVLFLLYANCKERVETDTKEVSRSSERYFVRVSRVKTRDECRRLYLMIVE
jgi:hypothetical protein